MIYDLYECGTALNKDVYETVCAFLNRSGGELLLGVRDDGVISGIGAEHIQQIKILQQPLIILRKSARLVTFQWMKS